MKNKLLLILVFISCLANAQIVYIPHEGFKTDLIQVSGRDQFGNTIAVDANHDGEIQVSEALAIWEVILGCVPDMQGLEAFTNLRKLTIIETYAVHHDFSYLQNLESLTIEMSNTFESLDISGMQSLKVLTISNAFYVSQILWDGTPNLEEIVIMGTFENLDFSEMHNLKHLYIDGFLRNIDLSANDKIERLSYSFYVPYDINTEYGVINIGNKPYLTELFLNFADDFHGEMEIMPAIDLSQCAALEWFRLTLPECQQSKFVNLKNGVTNYTSFNVNLNSTQESPVYVCIDEVNENYFLQNGLNHSNILLNSYCSPGPGVKYNTIAGTVLHTNDGDCTQNGLPSSNLRIKTSNGNNETITLVSTIGEYKFYKLAGNYTIAPQFENPGLFTVTPPSATVNFADNNNNTAIQNFCITPVGVHPDLEIVIAPVDAARPGFDANYKIVYKNKGNQTLSGAVSFTYDDALLDYVAATPAYTTYGAGQLSWNYTNLLPFESRAIEVKMNLNGPMETPPVNNGDFLNYSAAITPLTGDETPGDNTFNIKQEVVGSYDPNDITCLEGDIVHPDNIGKYLHYNINFENTGTAPATFIVVKDVINAQQFDISTLQVLYASHNVETKVTGNKIEFIFNDINLAALGKGNVVFKIKTKPTVAVNSTVSQKADIFFDYNWPIITNDANTTFTILSRGDFKFDQSVKIYPNPASTIFTIEASSDITSIQLYDVQGRQLQALSADGQSRQIDVSVLPSGIYFIKAATQNGTAIQKVIKE